MKTKSERLGQHKRVYEAVLYKYKTFADLKQELGVGPQVIQGALVSLLASNLITKRYGETADRAIYKAIDSSGIYSFEEKIKLSKNKTPAVIGRCDIAASWIPRTSS